MAEAPHATNRSRGSLPLLLIVALAGAGTMVVELAAVRVLAPWFGTSSAVWTNVIGVVLGALALGYWIGSRLSGRAHPTRLLGLALFLAAFVVAWTPALSSPVAEWLRPAGVTLDRAAELLLWGSLAASFLLFAPAAVALGCVGPLAVESVQRQTAGHAGTAGGAVLFASTLGSLFGTFGTTHYLVPALGVNLCFYLAAACLALGGLAAWAVGSGSVLQGVACLFLVATAGFGKGYLVPTPNDDVAVLAERQSPYQFVRVTETRAARHQRQLQVNEGLDSFQSVWQPELGLLGPGFYYDYFAPPAWWGRPEERWKVMVLGLGAGTAWRVLEGSLPDGVELVAHGAEIDPTVVELAREFMEMAPDDEDHQAWAGWDGRAALAHSDQDYDQIILDAYANQMEVPAHLCSVEFFEEVFQHLKPGGWLSINIGGFGTEDPVVRAIGGTAALAFEQQALVVQVPFSRNCVLYLRREGELPQPGKQDWSVSAAAIDGLLDPVTLSSNYAWIPPASAPLTDDHNPIDALQRQSIVQATREVQEVTSAWRTAAKP